MAGQVRESGDTGKAPPAGDAEAPKKAPRPARDRLKISEVELTIDRMALELKDLKRLVSAEGVSDKAATTFKTVIAPQIEALRRVLGVKD